MAIKKNENETWDLVESQTGKHPIPLKWIFKTKFNANGSLQKHKARLVSRGFRQEQGVDLNETFSPVARIETIRLILALAG